MSYENRNPDFDSNGPWCYTLMNDFIAYETCGIPQCQGMINAMLVSATGINYIDNDYFKTMYVYYYMLHKHFNMLFMNDKSRYVKGYSILCA